MPYKYTHSGLTDTGWQTNKQMDKISIIVLTSDLSGCAAKLRLCDGRELAMAVAVVLVMPM